MNFKFQINESVVVMLRETILESYSLVQYFLILKIEMSVFNYRKIKKVHFLFFVINTGIM